VAAAVALAILFVIIQNSTRRLPLRAMFLVTSSFLFLMGLKFVGEGLKEFQEQAMIPFDPMPGSETLERLGLNPTWEALGAQVLVVIVAIASMVWLKAQAETRSAS
jgi:high-affinity iron transporter